VVLLPGDPDFPDRVLLAPDPPRILFAIGRTDLLRTPGVAVVGSRDHSPYGAAACAQVVVAAVAARATVISGLARGIDAIAHRETLLLGGDTVAVLGHGVDHMYPRANRALYREVQSRGLLVSEYPPGTPPERHRFLQRNRIIAALSAVTVVVEAGGKSGALSTAGAALERSCDVMAVPGPITSATHVGCNRLIRVGATPFLEARDLWDLLRVPADRPPVLPVRPLASTLPGDLSRDERTIALQLADGECSVDELGQCLDAPVHDLSGALLGLELRGVVETRPGRRFRLAEPWRTP
jgi:DNA processing protein